MYRRMEKMVHTKTRNKRYGLGDVGCASSSSSLIFVRVCVCLCNSMVILNFKDNMHNDACQIGKC